MINFKDSSLENWLKTSSIKSILGCLINALNRWIEFLVVLLVGLIWEIKVDNPSESSLNIPSRWKKSLFLKYFQRLLIYQNS